MIAVWKIDHGGIRAKARSAETLAEAQRRICGPILRDGRTGLLRMRSPGGLQFKPQDEKPLPAYDALVRPTTKPHAEERPPRARLEACAAHDGIRLHSPL